MRLLTSIAITSATIFMASSAYADGPLKSEMSAYLVTASSDGQEIVKETNEATPGDLIEYRLNYKNISDRSLSGVIIGVPIPDATLFKINSERATDNSVFEVSADDGKSWGVPPLYRETVNGKIEISVSEYDLVRWMPRDNIDAGESLEFAYRVAVN